jgi:hypothetical protein
MAEFLALLATLVNLLGLAVTLSLGFYIVTRTLGSRLSWLAALTLWSVSCFFLHNTLVISQLQAGLLPWLRAAAVLALAFGFHLLLLLPPERHRPHLDFFLPCLHLPGRAWARMGARWPAAERFAVPLVYGLALAMIFAGVFPLAAPATDVLDSAVYLSDRVTGPLYPVSIFYLLLLSALALLHLWQRRQLNINSKQGFFHDPLLLAIVLVTLGGLYLSVGAWLGLKLPSFPGDAAVGVAAVLLGYAVARHNALVAGISIRRDLLYLGLAIGSFTVFYVVVAEILYLGGHRFSTLTLILLVVVAISSLMLYDGLRTTIDRLFYREQFRQFRANLRALARETGVGQSLADRLQAALAGLCRTLQLDRGIIALREGDAFLCVAALQAGQVGHQFPLPALAAEEMVSLPRADTPGPEGFALLLPIYDGETQVGALAVNSKETGEPYSEEDLLFLEDVADQLATVVRDTHLQEENTQAISSMVADFRDRERALQRQMQQLLAERDAKPRPVLEGVSDKQFVSLLEDALRRLHDYPYLGEHPLAQLAVVDWYLRDCAEGFVTHLDRGKALSEAITRALSKLRPEEQEPDRHAIAPREWHSFLVLHDAYVLGELNRDIMSRLYIGEGTFNRTRRSALRGVAKALQEMERETRQRA